MLCITKKSISQVASKLLSIEIRNKQKMWWQWRPSGRACCPLLKDTSPERFNLDLLETLPTFFSGPHHCILWYFGFCLLMAKRGPLHISFAVISSLKPLRFVSYVPQETVSKLPGSDRLCSLCEVILSVCAQLLKLTLINHGSSSLRHSRADLAPFFPWAIIHIDPQISYLFLKWLDLASPRLP